MSQIKEEIRTLMKVAQKDMTKSTIDPLSSDRSSSVNLDYESQKYDELVKEIINNPENLELIKKNIDLLLLLNTTAFFLKRCFESFLQTLKALSSSSFCNLR